MTDYRKRLAEACKRLGENPESDEAAQELVRTVFDCPLDDPAFEFAIPRRSGGVHSGEVDHMASIYGYE